MGSGRGCHPVSPIFTPATQMLKTFVTSEFCYYSFKGIGDMHIKLIRGRDHAHLKKCLTADAHYYCDPVYQIRVLYLVVELCYGNLFVFD